MFGKDKDETPGEAVERSLSDNGTNNVALADREGTWELPLEERVILAAAGVFIEREGFLRSGEMPALDATIERVEAWAGEEPPALLHLLTLRVFTRLYLEQE